MSLFIYIAKQYIENMNNMQDNNMASGNLFIRKMKFYYKYNEDIAIFRTSFSDCLNDEIIDNQTFYEFTFIPVSSINQKKNRSLESCYVEEYNQILQSCNKNLFIDLKFLENFKFRYKNANFAKKINNYSQKLLLQLQYISKNLKQNKLKKQKYDPSIYLTTAYTLIKTKFIIHGPIKFEPKMSLNRKTSINIFINPDCDKILLNFEKQELIDIKNHLEKKKEKKHKNNNINYNMPRECNEITLNKDLDSIFESLRPYINNLERSTHFFEEVFKELQQHAVNLETSQKKAMIIGLYIRVKNIISKKNKLKFWKKSKKYHI